MKKPFRSIGILPGRCRTFRLIVPSLAAVLSAVLSAVWSAFLAAFLAAVLAAPVAEAVVISEIHYHPPPGDEALEFVEITNDSSAPEDVSGWSFVEGIYYEIPAGTVLDPWNTLVVCADVAAVRARYGIANAVGDFGGRLDGSGERLTLANHAGVPVSSLRYRDDGKWPVAPDGMGHTLSLLGIHLDPGEPESWAPSAQLGGTPGEPNFERGGEAVVETAIVEPGEEWRFAKGTGPFSSPDWAWVAPAFDDASWSVGPSGFGYREVGAGSVAYIVPAGLVGNQSFGGPLGMDFDVVRSVEITRLGVFDSGSDGLFATIVARLFDRGTLEQLASLTFSPASPGELIGGSRFKDLPAPAVLPAGFRGTIVAEGYGAAEPNGNQGSGALGLATESGGGALSFVGGGRYGTTPGTYPDVPDGGPANRYAAGTFVFAVGETPGGTIGLPPGAATLLDDMPGSYGTLATRKRFPLDPATLDAPGDFILAVDHDDGFAAYINGVEVARSNIGSAGGPVPSWDSSASGTRSWGQEDFFPVPGGALLAGENVLAIVGLNAEGGGPEEPDPDFLLAARLFKRRIFRSDGGGVVFNELYRGATAGGAAAGEGPAGGAAAGEGWVELYNAGASPADLSGYAMTDGPDRAIPYVLPQGSRIEAGGFLAVSEAACGLGLSLPRVQVFLIEPSGTVVAASTFDRGPPPGRRVGDYSECRFPDGAPHGAPGGNPGGDPDGHPTVHAGGIDWVSEMPTRGAPNIVQAVDAVVINEILYHPPEDRTGEFIELYNRGASGVDLSGFRFEAGVAYTFPAGVSLAPGGYLVVSGDPEYIAEHYGIAALGPWEGRLSDAGEAVRLVDRAGNPVDRVRYHDGGRWPHWADGGGSSLELIDPAQDNSFASAWEASDETGKSTWERLSFHVPSYRPAAESELNLYLVKRGECLIDEVSVRRDGGPNLIPNPGFESSTSPWILGGTHIHSRRTEADAASGAASLHLIATGKGDTLVNRIEVETSPAMTAGPYDVALSARWIAGTSVIVVHGEFTAGPFRPTPCITCGVPAQNWSGNSLQAALRLSVPRALGTPGAENSVRKLLRAAAGSGNLGPVAAEVEHAPPSPAPGMPAVVTARVSDSDGIASVEVRYRTGGPAGAFAAAPLLDDGLHGDGRAGDGIHGGVIPGFPALTKVVFYIEATDLAGAVRRFPVEAPEKTCLYQVQGDLEAPQPAYRIVLDDARTTELRTRQLHSNDILDAAFVFENEEVRYDVGTRYRGSPWGRPAQTSFMIRFAEDERFHRGRTEVSLSNSGGSATEAAAIFLTARNALPGKPAPSPDYAFVRGWFNGSPLGLKADIETIDGDLLDRWFGPGAEGPLLKANGRFVFTDAGGLIGQHGWEGASLIYRGDHPENYRNYFIPMIEQTRDDWDPLIRLVRVLDASETPDAVFAEEVERIVDLEGFFQVLSTRILLGDGDAWCVNNGHNGHLAFEASSGLWWLISFDMEASFAIGSPNLLASLDPGVQRLLSHPRTRRTYLSVLSRYEKGYWSTARAGPWLDALQRATGHGTQGVMSWIASNAARIRALVDPLEATPFRILTGGGEDFATDASSVSLEGEAPLRVAAMLYRVEGAGGQDGGAEFLPLTVAWTTPTRWRVELPLSEEVNAFELIGLDVEGSPVASASIAVTTSSPARLEVSGWFPSTGSVGGGTVVTYFGRGFASGLRVFFGGAESPRVLVRSAEVLEATTPRAPAPLPPDGTVDVEVALGARSIVIAGGFRYASDGRFIRGDANVDGSVDIADPVRTLLWLYAGGPAPPCVRGADTNDDGHIDASDAIALLSYLFRRGPPPAPPFPACGEDTTPDGLDCSGTTTCGG